MKTKMTSNQRIATLMTSLAFAKESRERLVKIDRIERKSYVDAMGTATALAFVGRLYLDTVINNLEAVLKDLEKQR